MKKIIALILVLFLVGCFGNPGRDYVPKDMKNEFCGYEIDFRYCKCAFHGRVL